MATTEPGEEHNADAVEVRDASALMVLGMHRSGTSLLSSILAASGSNVGKRTLASAPDNPHGYFEDLDFLEFHRACLSERGFTIMTPQASPIVWSDAELAYARRLMEEHAKAAAARRDPTHPTRPGFVFKDPRACLFASSWLTLEPTLRVVLIHRHPAAVVSSLLGREEPEVLADASVGVRAWVRYNRLALTAIEVLPANRAVVFEADAMFDAPGEVCERLASIGVEVAQETIERIAVSDEFARPKGVDGLLDWCEQAAEGVRVVRAKLLANSGRALADPDRRRSVRMSPDAAKVARLAVTMERRARLSPSLRSAATRLLRAVFDLMDVPPDDPGGPSATGDNMIATSPHGPGGGAPSLADDARLDRENSAHGVIESPSHDTDAKDTTLQTIANFIALPGNTKDFEVLEPAHAHLDTSTGIDMGGSELSGSYDEYVQRDPYPIPGTEDREGYYGPRHFDYWLSGLRDYTLLTSRLEERGIDLNKDEPILELGAASGRVSRHFHCQGGFKKIWCTDISVRHIEFVRRFMPPEMVPLGNTTLPNLPIADNALSLVYAFSVFTHIDEFEFAWIAELHRVLRPGGVAYLTVHSEDTWDRLNPAISLYNTLLKSKSNSLGIKITPELLNGPLPADRLVVGDTHVYGTNVFQSSDYLRSSWGRLMDFVDIIPAGAEYQDVVILRNPQ